MQRAGGGPSAEHTYFGGWGRRSPAPVCDSIEMMEMLAHRLTSLSASEVALLLVALQYAVVMPAWVVAAFFLPGERRATGWWALYAGASAGALLMIVLGMHDDNAPLRAMGNVAVVAATLALQRGVWSFTGQRRWTAPQLALLLVTLLMCWLAVVDAAWVPQRIAVVSGLWAGLYLWIATDVWRHVRQSQLRFGLLYAAPLLLAALLLAARALRAVQAPVLVAIEVEQNTLLNIGSSLTGLVAALVLQMMLVSLLVSRLVGRLARLSRHDALTGLLNRRAIDELMGQEEQRARRLTGQATGRVALLMIDIDHFKCLNDSQGHAVGDRALQHLAVVMSAQLRGIDYLARWGGEEFLALLPATSGDEALAIAERLCERVRNLPLVHDERRLLLTVSVGVADWHGPQDSMADLLRRADAALYDAKHGGRDRVRRSGPAVVAALQTVQPA